MPARKTAVLIIVDGGGHCEDSDANVIVATKTPVWSQLWAIAPTLLRLIQPEQPAEMSGTPLSTPA